MDHYIVHPSIKDLITKLSLLGFTLLLFLGCDNNSRVDCATVLCAPQALSIALVDTEGVNLLANETYPLDNIVVIKDDIQVNESGNAAREAIVIYISGAAGNNTYEVVLSASETDILELELSKNGPSNGCCSPLFTIEKARYNGVDLEIIREPSQIEKIIVVK